MNKTPQRHIPRHLQQNTSISKTPDIRAASHVVTLPYKVIIPRHVATLPYKVIIPRHVVTLPYKVIIPRVIPRAVRQRLLPENSGRGRRTPNRVRTGTRVTS